MKDYSTKIGSFRPFIRPLSQSMAWVAAFVIANLIAQEPVFFIILLLVLGVDVLEFGDMRRSLFRDFVAGATIMIVAMTINDPVGVYAGVTISTVAMGRMYQTHLSTLRIHRFGLDYS